MCVNVFISFNVKYNISLSVRCHDKDAITVVVINQQYLHTIALFCK